MGISDASHPLVPLTLAAHLPLVVPLCCASLVPLVHLAGCCITSHHTAASHPPAPPPLIALPPLIAPLLHLLSNWLSCHLLSRHRLPSTCASASHHTAASYCPPLTPLVCLVVASPLVMLLPPILLRLRLSLHCHLSVSFDAFSILLCNFCVVGERNNELPWHHLIPVFTHTVCLHKDMCFDCCGVCKVTLFPSSAVNSHVKQSV